jgi:molecular chaperone DnaK (HSP70)
MRGRPSAYVEAELDRLRMEGETLMHRIGLLTRQLEREDDQITAAERKRIKRAIALAEQELATKQEKIENMYKKKAE